MSGFEIFGVLAAIPTAIIELNRAVGILRDQYQAFVENDNHMTRVATLYDTLSDLIPRFLQELRVRRHMLPPFSLAALTHEFQDVKRRLDCATSDLRNITSRDAKSSQVVRFLRSRDIRQNWRQLETDYYQLMHSIRHMSITCTDIDIVVSCFRSQEQRMIHELNKIREMFLQALPHQQRYSYARYADTVDTTHVTPLHHPERSLRDLDMNFTCAIHVPMNPPYVMTDFTNPNSPESQLVSRIMRENQNDVPDIYSSRKLELTGKGGRGKTCILRSICTNETITSKFTGAGKGGIYYMNLGRNPRVDDVRRSMCEIVECSGGGHLRHIILEENISVGISILVAWFKHKDTLFLIDEAYDDTDFGASVAEQLVALSTTSAASAVVFSRRRSRFSLGEVVRIYPENESDSRTLLLRSAECDPNEIRDAGTEEAIDSIVKMCHGNMRLLGQAGACYKHICGEEDRDVGWQTLAERLRLRLGDEEDEQEAQDALISEILNALQVGIGKVLVPAPSLHCLYRALHAVKARDWIPLDQLSGVWGIGCEECVLIANVLLRGRLCRITERRIGGVFRKGVEIHDCLWDYMVRQAVRHGEAALTA